MYFPNKQAKLNIKKKVKTIVKKNKSNNLKSFFFETLLSKNIKKKLTGIKIPIILIVDAVAEKKAKKIRTIFYSESINLKKK